MKSNLKIAVNQNRLISNLSSVFSNNTKYIAELMQNARRAGATKIHIAETGKILSIGDNGSGIKNFQDILTLAESGWDPELIEEEGAYGMGFFSALFAAKKVVVKSMGQQITIDTTQDFLNQDILIEPSTVQGGTVVELHNFVLPKSSSLYNELCEYCKGFPVDVYFSGKTTSYGEDGYVLNQLMKSENRLGDDFAAFDAGYIRLDMDQLKRSLGYSYKAFLQGFKVDEGSQNSQYYCCTHIDIHLHPSFKARMPDRDTLINAAEEGKRIQEAIEKHIKSRLLAIKANNPVDLFEYAGILSTINALDLLNDIEILPPHYFVMCGFPVKESDHVDTQDQALEGEKYLPRSYFADQVIVEKNPSDWSNEDGDLSMALRMGLYLSKTLVLNQKLHEDHWIYTYTRELPDTDADVEDGEETEVQVIYHPVKSGKWEGIGIHLVDSYSIRIPSLGIDVQAPDGYALALGADDNGPCALNDIILPPQADEDVLYQIRTWYSEYSYDESWAESERSSLQAYIDILRGGNPAKVLETLLGRTDCIIRRELQGKTFSVTFNDHGDPTVTM